MVLSSVQGAGDQGSGSPAALQEVLTLLGRALNSASVYGVDHPQGRKAIEQIHAQLSPHLQTLKRVNINLISGRLHINGRSPEQASPFVRILESRMNSQKAGGFSLVHGLTCGEFEQFLRLLTLSKPGEFDEKIKAAGLHGVDAHTVTYRAVTGDEVVVSREEMAHGTAGGGAAPGGTGGGGTAGGGRRGILDLDDVDGAPAAAGPPTGAAGVEEEEEPQRLSRLFEQLESLVREGAMALPSVGAMVVDLDRATAQATQAATRRLDRLEMELREMRRGRAGPVASPAAQERLLVFFAEFIHEIIPPLTVIHCACALVNSGAAGRLNPSAAGLMRLAGAAGEQLRHLGARLAEMVARAGGPASDRQGLWTVGDDAKGDGLR